MSDLHLFLLVVTIFPPADNTVSLLVEVEDHPHQVRQEGELHARSDFVHPVESQNIWETNSTPVNSW